MVNELKIKEKKLANSAYQAGQSATAEALNKSKPKHIFFISFFIFVLLNVLLIDSFNKIETKRNLSEILEQTKSDRLNKKSMAHSWPWWLSKFYLDNKKAPDIVVFGSSLIGTAHAAADAQYLTQLIDVLAHRKMEYFEAQLFNRFKVETDIFSLASPGQMISDSYVISKTLITNTSLANTNRTSTSNKPKLVIVTIAPRDFIDSTLAYPAITDYYQFFSKYNNFNYMTEYAYPDFMSKLNYYCANLPFKKACLQLFDPKNTQTQDMEENENKNLIALGQSTVPANVKPICIDNTKEYIERFRNPFSTNYQVELQFFTNWLKDLRKENIQVLVVVMPTMQINRELLPKDFWRRFYTDIKSVCTTTDSEYYDLSSSGLFNQQDYLDTVHLNAYGSVKLFPVLAERICMSKNFCQALAKKDNL